MKIILEGPEGAGKSTLAKQLSAQTGFPIAHRDKPKSEEEKKQMMNMYVKSMQNHDNEIWDRCWYSEMVYGPVMRDASYITVEQMDKLEELLQYEGAIIIYCTDEPRVLWDRAIKRGEDYITNFETMLDICRAYDKVMHGLHHKIPVVRYELSKQKMP